MSLEYSGVVQASGIGRKDNSVSVQVSVNPLIISHQMRYMWIVDVTNAHTAPYLSPAWTLGDYHSLRLWTPPNFIDEDPVPESPKITIYDIMVTGSQNLPTLAALIHYPTYDSILTGPPDVIVSWRLGMTTSNIHFNKGHTMIPGRFYVLGFMQWGGLPHFDCVGTIHALSDELVG